MSSAAASVQAHLTRRARWSKAEIAFWIGLVVLIFALPSRAPRFHLVDIAGGRVVVDPPLGLVDEVKKEAKKDG